MPMKYYKQPPPINGKNYTAEEDATWFKWLADQTRKDALEDTRIWEEEHLRPKFCPNCNRKIDDNNHWLSDAHNRCEGCENDSMQRFVLGDILLGWFTGYDK